MSIYCQCLQKNRKNGAFVKLVNRELKRKNEDKKYNNTFVQESLFHCLGFITDFFFVSISLITVSDFITCK